MIDKITDNEYISNQLEGVEEVALYSFKNYSHWRCKSILHEEYGIQMVARQGYKLTRATNGRNTYRLIWEDSKQVLNESVSLRQVQVFLSSQGFSLKPKEDKKSEGKTKRRNPKADLFLQIIDNIGSDDVGNGRS